MIFQALLVVFSPVHAFQNSYVVKQERFETEYFNPDLCNVYSGVFKYNRTTNAINVTLSFKVDIDETDKCVIKGYKWMSNQYRLDILQFENTIKNMISINYFDIARLRSNYTTPPFSWPVQKNVEYKMRNWIPDSREFPPGMPAGKWKISVTFQREDKTVFFTLNWYVSLQYKVKYYKHH